MVEMESQTESQDKSCKMVEMESQTDLVGELIEGECQTEPRDDLVET